MRAAIAAEAVGCKDSASAGLLHGEALNLAFLDGLLC